MQAAQLLARHIKHEQACSKGPFCLVPARPEILPWTILSESAQRIILANNGLGDHLKLVCNKCLAVKHKRRKRASINIPKRLTWECVLPLTFSKLPKALPLLMLRCLQANNRAGNCLAKVPPGPQQENKQQ